MRATLAILIFTFGCCSLFLGACIDGATPNCDAGSGCEPGETSTPDTSTIDSGNKETGLVDSPSDALPDVVDASVKDAPPG
jgi:hypothetical protein